MAVSAQEFQLLERGCRQPRSLKGDPNRLSDCAPSPDRLLQIATTLQSTLDLPELLALFAGQISRELPHAGLHYASGASDTGHVMPEVSIGHVHGHRISYQMDLYGADLGTLSLVRGLPFSMRELDILEHLLGILMHPLRNACLYAAALRSAQTDPLTGLGNRTAFDLAMAREVASAQRHGLPLSLLMIDVDRFKAVNDTYGHLVGDRVLRAVAQTLRSSARDTDQVFRFGGEEFVMILGNTGPEGARVLAERVRARVLDRPVEGITTDPLSVSVSVGLGCLALHSPDGHRDTVSGLLERADRALYRAKNAGRNCVNCE